MLETTNFAPGSKDDDGWIVPHCLRCYRHRVLPAGLSRSDLRQEAAYALLVARRDFDPARGSRFSTYAVAWVSGHLRHVIEDAVACQAELPTDMDRRPDQSADPEVAAVADLVWELVEELDSFAREAVIRRWGLDGYGAQSEHLTASSMGVSRKKISGSVRRSLSVMRARLAGEVA